MRDFELMLINDNPDLSEEIRRYIERVSNEDKRIVLVHNQENIGLPASMNKGIFLAKGEYIARMDADDISDPNRLKNELAFLNDNNLDMVSAQVKYINESGEGIGESSDNPRDPMKALDYRNNLNHPTVLVKTSVLRKINGYREMKNSEDYDLWLRIKDSGYRIGISPDKLLYYRVRDNGVSRSRGLEQHYISEYIRKLHKQRVACGKDDFTKDNMQKYLDSKNITEKRNNRYNKAADYLVKATELRRVGNKKWVENLVISFFMFPAVTAEAIRYEINTKDAK